MSEPVFPRDCSGCHGYVIAMALTGILMLSPTVAAFAWIYLVEPLLQKFRK